MNTQEMIEQVYEDVGSPTDLCPYTDPDDTGTFDIAEPGAVSVLRALNQGVIRIAGWRFRDNRVLRHRGLMGRKYFDFGEPIEGTVISAGVRTLEVPGLGADEADEFDGWMVEITSGLGVGESSLVVGGAVGVGSVVLTLATAWTVVPDAASEFRLYKSFAKLLTENVVHPDGAYHVALDPQTELADVVGITDVETGTALETVYGHERLAEANLQKGVPSRYVVSGDRIQFDVASDERKSYEMEYVKQPMALGIATDVPELPSQFHEAVVLWAVHNFQRKQQAFEKAYATKRELEDLMNMLRLEGHFADAYGQSGIVVY